MCYKNFCDSIFKLNLFVIKCNKVMSTGYYCPVIGYVLGSYKIPNRKAIRVKCSGLQLYYSRCTIFQ